jgi:hypothetical protein
VSALVVAAKEEYLGWIPELQSVEIQQALPGAQHQSEFRATERWAYFDTKTTTVDVVAEEKVVVIRYTPSHVEELH